MIPLDAALFDKYFQKEAADKEDIHDHFYRSDVTAMQDLPMDYQLEPYDL